MTDAPSLLERIDALVIGASAGGVEALMRLLPVLPAGTRVPVAVVLHLPRSHPSSLVEIFTAKCALPVREAEDKTPVEPGVVYFAPPDYHLLIDAASNRIGEVDAVLALSADDPVNYSRPSIDVLFESASDFYRDRVAGVILTGANADGADGLAVLRRAGGLGIVQDPSTAYASAMPAAAIDRGAADLVLPLEGIADLLRGLR